MKAECSARSRTNSYPLALVKLVQSEPGLYKLVNGNRLRFDVELTDYEERYLFVNNLIQHLSEHAREDAA